MEVLLKWQEWLEHSKLYTEFLVHLPAPLNNVYFDLIILIILCVMVLQWILDALAMRKRYKKIRKRQKKIQEAQEYADMESLYRDREAKHRQEQMERQMKAIQMYLMLQYMPKNRNVQALEEHKGFYLPYDDEFMKTDFERLMERLNADESMQMELENQKAMQDAMAEQNYRELDRKMKTETVSEEVIEEQQIDPEKQKEIERRKAMAVKLALKEQKRAERKQKWGNRK